MDEALFGQLLATAEAPPPDLIVRPSGRSAIGDFSAAAMRVKRGPG